MLERLAGTLFLATLALLPWGGLLGLPALHEHAQWSDLVFAAAALVWGLGLLAGRGLPRPRLLHVGLALYLGWAALSLFFAVPRPESGKAKLLGMAMLVALLVVSSEMARRPGMPARIGRVVAATTLLSAAAAVAGVLLSAFGRTTPFVGGPGDLLPGPLARAQAGFPHPNLLASYCLFAFGVVGREDAGLSRRGRSAVRAAIALTLLLTFSRALLGLVLAFAVERATTPARRRAAGLLAVALLLVMAALTVGNLRLDPVRPWRASLSPLPSPRLVAAETAFETLRAHPWLGSGPGSSPGRREGLPFDAHLTPLNVAATLGLPALASLALSALALWAVRSRPTDRVSWGMLAGIALDGLAQDVEDFRHVWVALGLADAGRENK